MCLCILSIVAVSNLKCIVKKQKSGMTSENSTFEQYVYRITLFIEYPYLAQYPKMSSSQVSG